MIFPDFSRSAALGFEQGRQMGEGQNPLGQFIKTMLADWQQRKAVEQEYGMKVGLVQEEAKAKQKYPSPWEAYFAKQLEKENEGKGGILPTTPEKAKTTFLSENTQYKPEDIIVTPKPVPGGKGLTYYEPSVSPEAQARFKKEEEAKVGTEERNQIIKENAQDILNTLGEVKKGINYFGLTGSLPSLPGTPRYNWETNINKLLSGKIIDTMTKMKEASKTGATGFGQLSNKELEVLRESSTALKKGLSPRDALKHLNVMEEKFLKVIQNQQTQTKNYIRTGIDTTTGKRIGMLSDGTIEER